MIRIGSIKNMEDNSLTIKKQAKRAAYLAGIAIFLGFSMSMFDPRTYSGGMTNLIIILFLGLMPIGFLLSYLTGKAVYSLFKKFNKDVPKIVIVILFIICYLLGIAIFGSIGLLFHAITKTK